MRWLVVDRTAPPRAGDEAEAAERAAALAALGRLADPVYDNGKVAVFQLRLTSRPLLALIKGSVPGIASFGGTDPLITREGGAGAGSGGGGGARRGGGRAASATRRAAT